MRSWIFFIVGSDSRASVYSAGDLGLISSSKRYPGEGNGKPLHYSCLKNPMARGAWWAAVHGLIESDMTEQLSLDDVSVLLFQFIPYSPSLTLSASLFFMSASLSLPCKQIHQYHFSRFHMHVYTSEGSFLNDVGVPEPHHA